MVNVFIVSSRIESFLDTEKVSEAVLWLQNDSQEWFIQSKFV